MSAARVARAKFSREFDNARLTLEARLQRRRQMAAKLDAEVDEAYKSLDDLLRIIGQSLAELEQAA